MTRTRPPRKRSRRTARPPTKRSRPAAWRRPAGWAAVGVGAVLVFYGFLGGALGIRLPLDRHHLLSQISGLLLVILGLVWATTQER